MVTVILAVAAHLGVGEKLRKNLFVARHKHPHRWQLGVRLLRFRECIRIESFRIYRAMLDNSGKHHLLCQGTTVHGTQSDRSNAAPGVRGAPEGATESMLSAPSGKEGLIYCVLGEGCPLVRDTLG